MSNLKLCGCGGAPDTRNTFDEDGCAWYFIQCRGCGTRTRGKWVSASSDTCPIFYEEVRGEWNTAMAR